MKNILLFLSVVVLVSMSACSGGDSNSANSNSGGAQPQSPGPTPHQTTPVAACLDLSGSYSSNGVDLKFVQTGCSQVTAIQNGVTRVYIADRTERKTADVDAVSPDEQEFAKYHFESDRFVAEERFVSSKGESTLVTFYQMTSKPCDLAHPEPGAIYLVAQTYVNDSADPVQCLFWKKN
jgi:hypothetical protein